jgi:hypothetical protein
MSISNSIEEPLIDNESSLSHTSEKDTLLTKLTDLNESAVTSFNAEDIEVAYANLKKAETLLEVRN